MTSHQPAWTAFAPEVPPTLPEADFRRGRIVAVVACEGAVEAGWAADVATDLARGWSAAGRRVVLVDGGLESPSIHRSLEVPNLEGLTDALVWGASVQRVAVKPDGARFFLITAGTPTADSGTTFAGPKWAHLCAGFRDAGVTLVAFVPKAEAGAAHVLSEADDVVVLATAGEDAGAAAGMAGDALRAVLGMSADPGGFPTQSPDDAPDDGSVARREDVATASPEPAPEDPLLVATPQDPLLVSTPGPDPIHDPQATRLLDPLQDPAAAAGAKALGEVQPGGVADPNVVVPAPTLEEIVEESESETAGGAAPRGRRNGLLFFLLLLLVAVLVAAWLGYVEIPGITPTGGSASAPASVTTVPPSEPEPIRREVRAPAGYSLALVAYQDGSAARARARQLTAAGTGVLFASIPVEVDGTLFHRVLAGPAADSADAAATSARVASATGNDPSNWVIRATPLAFLAAEMPGLADARQQADLLRGLDLPAYVLAVDYTDGSTAFRVYVGAYADEAEASYLAGQLSQRGLDATLTDRIGRLPA